MGHRLMQGIIPRRVSSQLGRGERKRGCIPFSVNAVTNTRPLVRRIITLEYMEFHANTHICTNCNERFQISLWNVSLCICICFGGFRNDWYLGDSRHSGFHHQFREIKYSSILRRSFYWQLESYRSFFKVNAGWGNVSCIEKYYR